MGAYIQTERPHDKAQQISEMFPDVQFLAYPPKWEDIPEDRALICVVDNIWFEAAGYVFSKDEWESVQPTNQDNRSRSWLLMNKVDAHKATGYSE